MKIGVFDSGLGGLTVLRALWKALPQADYIYLGDTARVPYGIRSKEVIHRYAKQSLEFLIRQHIDCAVVACNTVSAYTLDELKKEFPIPLIGVVEPGVNAVMKLHGIDVIGIIGTEATIRSEAYERRLRDLLPGVKIFSKACPLFVPLVEEGWLDHPITEAVIREYIGEFRKKGVKVLVLGCTHYPLLKPALQKVLGSSIRLIDSADETAHMVKEQIEPTSPGKRGSTQFYVTDQASRFDRIAALILDKPYGPVTQIEL